MPSLHSSMTIKTTQLANSSLPGSWFSSTSSILSFYSSLKVETTQSSNSSSTSNWFSSSSALLSYSSIIKETTQISSSFLTSDWFLSSFSASEYYLSTTAEKTMPPNSSSNEFSLSPSTPLPHSTKIIETIQSLNSSSSSIWFPQSILPPKSFSSASNWLSSPVISLFSSMTNYSTTQYITSAEIQYSSGITDVSYLQTLSSLNDHSSPQLLTPNTSTNTVDSLEVSSSQPQYLTTATTTTLIPRLSSKYYVDPSPSSIHIPTTTVKPSMNTPPIVKQLIDTLFFGAGRYSVHQVPSGVFDDKEDGSTRYLTLKCFTTSAGTLDSLWLVFNSTTQTLTAFPLETDYTKQERKALLVHLRAFDSDGLYATTQFEVAITAPLKDFSYLVVMKLLINYDLFISNKQSRFDLVDRMSQFYQTELNSTLYIHSVRNGSTILEFSNYILATQDTCDKESILQNAEVVKQRNTNEAQKNFEKLLSPEFPIINLELQYHGVCLSTPSQTPVRLQNGYLVYLTPLIIVIIILIIIIIIVVIFCRRQKNKRTFYVGSRRYEKGQPALFPDELELQAPLGKQQQPNKNDDGRLQQGAYVGPYDNDSLDSLDYGTQPRVIEAAIAASISSDDDSFYSYYKTPDRSPPEYAEPPPYTFPDNTYGSEI